MALLRKLFYRKPPDGLLEISERVYVFDCCFTTDSWEERDYKGYIAGIVSQLREQFPDSSLLVFNFRQAEVATQMSKIMSEYDMTIMDYPRHYEGCPILSMELIHHFLRSTESWLALGPHNVLLMHCEQGGWPVLAFMLAALLIYRKQYTGEQRTLDMVYKQAPGELLPMLSPLNPIPSQLRYLQYVSRRNVASQWPPLDRALTLDCVIIRLIPDFSGEGGCRPLFRIYGQDPSGGDDRAPRLLFSTQKKSKAIRLYKQAESELVKIDINCNIQGDVVLECASLQSDMEHEDIMFRIMFNTAFIRSNILMLNRDEIDTLWNSKDHFPKGFRAEVLFSDMDTTASVVADNLSCFEEKEGLPMEAFAKVQEFFSHVDWLDSRADAALSVIQKVSASRSFRESLDFAAVSDTESSTPVHRSSPRKIIEELKSDTGCNFEELDNQNRLLSKLLKDCNLGEKKVESNNFQVQPDQYQSGATAQNVAEASHTRMLSAGPSVSQESDIRPHGDAEDGKTTSAVSVLPEATCSIAPSTPPRLPSKRSPSFASASYPVPLSQQPHIAKSVVKSPRDHGCTGPEDAFQSSTCHPDAPATAEVLSSSSVNEDSSPREEPEPAYLSSSPATPSKQGSYLGTATPFSSTPKLTATPSRVEATLETPPARTAPTSSLPPHPALPLSPPEPTLYEDSAIGAGVQPPPLPTMPDASTQTVSNNLTKVRPPPPPPPPPYPVEGSAGKPVPPPPPVPPVPPSKENNSIAGRPRPPPPPPPPPPLQRPGSSMSSAAPPPPPPPGSGLAPRHLDSISHASSSVPCAPPPPVGFEKGARKTGTAAPAPAPPLSSLSARGRSLSRSLGPKNPQTKKLKPLHWLKLTRAVQGSLWAETQKSGEASNAPEIDMSELENLFSASAPNSVQGAAGGKSRPGVAGTKSEKVQLIDHRRAYNCEIMLSKVKVPLQELMVSVLSLEDSSLDIDQVDNLIKFCPTKEEMELLKGYSGEPDKLGKCEQFFLELMRVPRVEAKLRVFSFKMQFQTQVSDLRKSLNSVNSALDQIRSSVKLKRVMQTILSLGNALNQGTARGSAVGFRLDSLLKLTETRARNNKMTLMHYLCKVIAGKLPELLDFSKDLTSMEPASKIQLKFLAEEMQAINKGLEKVVQELSLSENDGPVSEEFRKNLKEFLYFAEAEVRSLALLYSGVGRNVDALIVYFGEDPSRCPFEQVVATLLNFTRMFNRAHEENCKQLELEKKKAEKDLENQRSAAQKESDIMISSPKSGRFR